MKISVEVQRDTKPPLKGEASVTDALDYCTAFLKLHKGEDAFMLSEDFLICREVLNKTLGKDEVQNLFSLIYAN
jgi:hypothetical protein